MKSTRPHQRAARTPVSAALADAFTLAVAIGAVLPTSALAAPIPVFADTTYEAHAEIIHPNVATYRSDAPALQQPHGDTTQVEAFVVADRLGPGWGFVGFGLGTPTNHPTEAFASARKRGNGIIDLGVSGASDGPGADDWGLMTADMFSSGRVTNTGTYGTIPMSYTIPLIEIATGHNRYNGVVAEVDVDYVLKMYDVNDQLLFDLSKRYTLTYDYFKPPTTFAIQTFTASDDLLNDGGGLVEVADCLGFLATCGRAFGSFSVENDWVLDTGDYLMWGIHASVFQVTGREGGGHALFGDPLSIGGEGIIPHLRMDIPAAVPEPTPLALLGLGLVALVGQRKLLP
jgi:hypothetical protein